jgi:hypothetical protein
MFNNLTHPLILFINQKTKDSEKIIIFCLNLDLFCFLSTWKTFSVATFRRKPWTQWQTGVILIQAVWAPLQAVSEQALDKVLYSPHSAIWPSVQKNWSKFNSIQQN